MDQNLFKTKKNYLFMILQPGINLLSNSEKFEWRIRELKLTGGLMKGFFQRKEGGSEGFVLSDFISFIIK
jgi:hypothetical protein